MKSAKLKAMAKELAGVKAKLDDSCLEGVNSRWSAHNIAKGKSTVEDDVSEAVTAISGEAANAFKRKLLSLGCSW